MDDPYKTLGVARTASAAEIRTAYRRLAKKNHPDLNPGEAAAENRFKAIASAYGLLSDPEKRARFDRGEIDASGAERPSARSGAERNFYRGFAEAGDQPKYGAGDASGLDDLDDLLGQVFGRRGGSGFRGRGFGGGDFGGGNFGGGDFTGRGADAHYTLTVDFLDAANGATRRLTLPDGKTLDVVIPPGLSDGQTLRLKGQGMPGQQMPDRGKGPAGGPKTEAASGDALIEVRVTPHPLFRRDGDDIVITLPVTLQEAVLGAKLEVPTIKGPVTLTIPRHSTSGTRLRLKGRGIARAGRPAGHQYVDLTVVTPSEPEPELEAFLETWHPRHPQNPRKGIAA
jgi:DnaJ-class molecular chaperone